MSFTRCHKFASAYLCAQDVRGLNPFGVETWVKVLNLLERNNNSLKATVYGQFKCKLGSKL